MELVKEEMTKEDLDAIAGGFQKVSDPIYKLEGNEEAVLRKCGYHIEKTNKGNCRVKYSNGTAIEPHVLENMCTVIKKMSN